MYDHIILEIDSLILDINKTISKINELFRTLNGSFSYSDKDLNLIRNCIEHYASKINDSIAYAQYIDEELKKL